MELSDWRTKIDEIDLELLRLLNKRSEHAIHIGELKSQHGVPVYSPEREERIMRRLLEENQGPLPADGVQRIFERIIDEARKLEKDACQKQK